MPKQSPVSYYPNRRTVLRLVVILSATFLILIFIVRRWCYFEYFDTHNPNDWPNEQQMKMRKKAQAESPQRDISRRQPTRLIGLICT